MNTSQAVNCPKGHGPLARLRPATIDGARIEIGGCWSCGGLWVPVQAVQHLFPQPQLQRFSESGFTDEGPRCGRCPEAPAMRAQTISGVEIDRCFSCLSLWLDGGELWLLGGGDRGAVADRSLCDVCGQKRSTVSATRTALGVVCGRCRSASPLEVNAQVVHSLGLGADRGDSTQRRILGGAEVESMYDANPGEPTLFQWRGPLANSSIRGTIGYETRITTILRSVGISDLEVGDLAFDARFKVRAERDDEMRRWLSSSQVRADLDLLADTGGCIVVVDRDGLCILGELPDGSPTPFPAVEEACGRLYISLRREG